MKVKYALPLPGKTTALLAVLLTACLVVITLAVACEEEEEATPTPADTPTAAVTATPAATAEVPGITDTEIILGADVPLSGALAAVYATIPQATQAYFDYINDTQGLSLIHI